MPGSWSGCGRRWRRRSGEPGSRSRLRAYLQLSRISNLPTVWTNVLAGMCAAGVALDPATYLQGAIAVSLFYTGGMFLNDAFDAPFDRQSRPERPIPAGDVSRTEVFAIGGACLAFGELLLAPGRAPLLFGLALAAAILLYDYQHKGSRVAFLVMGACRGLVYLVGASLAGGLAGGLIGSLTSAAIAGAAIMTAYVAGLTIVARMAGANARWLVPLLIAGISLVDALFIALVFPSIPLALLAVSAFGLTMVLQRWVAGD